VRLTPHPILVPWSRKNTAIPLLPLWAVRPVQSLSACTKVHFTFFYYSPITKIIKFVIVRTIIAVCSENNICMSINTFFQRNLEDVKVKAGSKCG